MAIVRNKAGKVIEVNDFVANSKHLLKTHGYTLIEEEAQTTAEADTEENDTTLNEELTETTNTEAVIEEQPAEEVKVEQPVEPGAETTAVEEEHIINPDTVEEEAQTIAEADTEEKP